MTGGMTEQGEKHRLSARLTLLFTVLAALATLWISVRGTIWELRVLTVVHTWGTPGLLLASASGLMLLHWKRRSEEGRREERLVLLLGALVCLFLAFVYALIERPTLHLTF